MSARNLPRPDRWQLIDNRQTSNSAAPGSGRGTQGTRPPQMRRDIKTIEGPFSFDDQQDHNRAAPPRCAEKLPVPRIGFRSSPMKSS